LRRLLASSLKRILKDEPVSEQEFALMQLCLQGDVCKPLINLTSVKDTHFTQAFK